MEPTIVRRPVHFGAAFFAFAAAGLCAAALLTTEWYNISAPGTLTANFGLFRSCVDGVCDKNTFTDFTSGTCERKGSDMETRTNAVFGLVVGGGFLALCTAILVLVSPKSRVASFICAICSFLSMGALAAGSALYPFTLHRWYYCDDAYCINGFTGTGTCESFFGYSYALAIVGAASAIVALVLVMVTLCSYIPPAAAVSVAQSDDAEGQAGSSSAVSQGVPMQPVSAQSGASPDARREERSRRDSRSPQPDARDGGVAENRRTTEMRALTSSTTNNQSLDGWELDENTGLYWSDREKLFYDPISGHFYDPESELWYDPSTEQWYQGAEQ